MAAEKNTEWINRIKSRRAFDEFYNLLGQCLPPSLISWYRNNKNGFRSIFVGLSDEERDGLLAVLRDDIFWDRNRFQCRVPDNLTVGWVFEALQWTGEYEDTEEVVSVTSDYLGAFTSSLVAFPEYVDGSSAFQSSYSLDIGNRHPNNNTAGTQSRLQRSQTLYDGYPPDVLTPNADVAYGPSNMNMGATMVAYNTSGRRSLDMSSNMNRSQRVGTRHHSERALLVPHNTHVIDSANTLYGNSSGYYRDSIDASNYVLNYGTSAQPYILPSHGSAILSHYNVRGHSHGHQRGFIDMSNSLPNYAARFQPPDRVGTTIIPVDGGSTSGHSARAIGDDEIDGHLKFQGSLLPAVFTICYQSSMILKSINNSPLLLSIKIYGYVIVGCAIVAAFASLGALSLCALKPNTLPFDCNPQNVIRTMHFVVAHLTGYAFIGLMCQTFLQDDSFIMWITAGLASAVFMALMIFIGNGKRR